MTNHMIKINGDVKVSDQVVDFNDLLRAFNNQTPLLIEAAIVPHNQIKQMCNEDLAKLMKSGQIWKCTRL